MKNKEQLEKRLYNLQTKVSHLEVIYAEELKTFYKEGKKFEKFGELLQLNTNIKNMKCNINQIKMRLMNVRED